MFLGGNLNKDVDHVDLESVKIEKIEEKVISG